MIQINTPKASQNQGIHISGIEYSYSIFKSEEEGESLVIQLYDPYHKSNFYFTYEAKKEQVKKDIKYLAMYDLDEIINSLKDVFSQGNIQVEENNGEFFIKFKIIGLREEFIIKLIKHEIDIKHENEIAEIKENNDIEDKINRLENKYNDLFNQVELIKKERINIKENDIRKIIKEIIFEKDTKMKLFEEFEEI